MPPYRAAHGESAVTPTSHRVSIEWLVGEASLSPFRAKRGHRRGCPPFVLRCLRSSVCIRLLRKLRYLNTWALRSNWVTPVLIR